MTVAANVEHGGTSRGLVPGRPTGPLMIFVGLASAVFTVGTALHAFVIVTPETLERMMVLAGATRAASMGSYRSSGLWASPTSSETLSGYGRYGVGHRCGCSGWSSA